MTTDTEEFTLDLPRDQWMTFVDEGTEPVELEFEVQPVPPTTIKVIDADSGPVKAKITVENTDWNYHFPERETDDEEMPQFRSVPFYNQPKSLQSEKTETRLP